MIDLRLEMTTAGRDREPSNALRPLSALEHMFWLIDQNRPCHFAVTALIAGKASPGDWRKALDHVQKRHPLLSVCIDGSPGSIPQFRQQAVAPIPLRVLAGDPTRQWESEVCEELATPFNPAEAPLIRAVLIEGSRDTGFILIAHHSIADGLSIAYAIRDTLSALSGEVLEPLDLAPALEEIVGAGEARTSLRDADGPQDGAPLGKPSRYCALHARPVVKGLRLTPALTTSLRDRARQEGTTVHGALCAALAIAGRQASSEWCDGALRILSPINIRSLVDAGESCGLFMSGAIGTLDGETGDFWDVARKAKAAVAAAQCRNAVRTLLAATGNVLAKGSGIAAAADFFADAFANEVMLTNLGALTFDSRFGPLELKAMWGPAVHSGLEGSQTIGVTTVNGSIYLTQTSYTPQEKLLEAMRSVLASACHQRGPSRISTGNNS